VEPDAPSAGDAADASGGDGTTEGGADATSDVAAESGGQDVVVSDSPCGCGPRSVCISGLCTGAQRVFVSSGIYSANLGGSPGADATCGMLATQAGLSGKWMAWLADGTNPPPSQRFYKSGPYRLLNTAVVALDFTALTTTDLFNAIDIDETGASQASSADLKVWTGTTATGDAAPSTCTGFTAGDASTVQGEVGRLTDTSSGNWAADATTSCNKPMHLYCFEQ
jgi:hypothetical protein